MALYAQIPKSPKKIKQGIIALEWQLKQEIPEKDRVIFEQTLRAYKNALCSIGSPGIVKIDFD